MIQERTEKFATQKTRNGHPWMRGLSSGDKPRTSHVWASHRQGKNKDTKTERLSDGRYKTSAAGIDVKMPRVLAGLTFIGEDRTSTQHRSGQRSEVHGIGIAPYAIIYLINNFYLELAGGHSRLTNRVLREVTFVVVPNPQTGPSVFRLNKDRARYKSSRWFYNIGILHVKALTEKSTLFTRIRYIFTREYVDAYRDDRRVFTQAQEFKVGVVVCSLRWVRQLTDHFDGYVEGVVAYDTNLDSTPLNSETERSRGKRFGGAVGAGIQVVRTKSGISGVMAYKYRFGHDKKQTHDLGFTIRMPFQPKG